MRLLKHWQIIVVVLLCFASFVLMTFPFIHDLDKDVLPISLTYDNFYHPLMAKAVYETGQNTVYAHYRAMGTKDALLADPPLPYSIPATVTMLTSAPLFSVFMILVALFQIFLCLGVYAIVRRYFGNNVGLFTLAIALIPATSAWLFQYFIGFTTSLEAFAFVPLILFLLLYLFDKKSALAAALIGGALSAQFMIHGPIEAAYVYIFSSIAMAAVWYKTRHPWLIKSWLIMTAAAVILGLYQYLLLRLFRLTGQSIYDTLLAGNPIPPYFPKPHIAWPLLILAMIGAFVLVTRLFSKKFSKQQTTFVLFIVLMIALVFSYVLGVDGTRAMRQLYNAYPLLAFIPAAGIVALFGLVKSRIPDKAIPAIEICMVIIIAYLSFTVTFKELSGLASAGMATPERWQALQWIKQNTPADSRVFYLFGFEHEFEMLAERVPFKGDLGLGFTQKNIVELCKGNYPKTFAGQWGGAFTNRPSKANGTLEYLKYAGLFKFPFVTLYRPKTTTPIANVGEEVPLSTLDYVALQYKGTQADPCMAFFINQSLSRGNKLDWYNDQFAVLEVKK